MKLGDVVRDRITGLKGVAVAPLRRTASWGQGDGMMEHKPHPNGKPRSDGQIRVGFHQGAVILDLGDEMGAVALKPDQAKQLARRLLTYANPVTRP